MDGKKREGKERKGQDGRGGLGVAGRKEREEKGEVKGGGRVAKREDDLCFGVLSGHGKKPRQTN